MTDGTIIIDGTAGLEVGMRMKRGIIVIGGRVRDFAGLQMKGGTIVLRQRRRAADRRLDDPRHHRVAEADSTPADVRRGRSLQPDVPAPLRQAPANSGLLTPLRRAGGRYQRYTGDASVPGKGEILVWQDHADSMA